MERERKETERQDQGLLLLVLLLLVCGLVFLYSTSAYNGRVKFHDSAYYFKKQLFATSLGLMGMYLISCMDYHVLVRFAPFFYLISLLLSLAVLLFGDEYNGSKRWLSIGPLSFQPSEFAKVAVILLLTWVIIRGAEKAGNPSYGRYHGAAFAYCGAGGNQQSEYGNYYSGNWGILIFVSNPRYLPFLGIGAAGVVFIGIFLGMASYRLERLAIWRNPEAYEKGFQTIQGLYAIGSGGIFGRGIGSSLQKLGFVPEAQNDMIFSIICEETGLVGACLLILLFGMLIWRLMVISTHARDLCGALLAAGIMGHMAMQVILNIAVVTNTIPNTGITLPFVSYGGTSVLFLLGEMGIALSVSRHQEP